MRVIARPILREFWESDREAESPLRTWEGLTKGADWSNWGDLKQTFGTADRVGNCVVFDVGNNRYRLIARVVFDKGRVFVLKIMKHAEYDKKDPKNKGRAKWVDECRCHQPPPKKKAKGKR